MNMETNSTLTQAQQQEHIILLKSNAVDFLLILLL